MTAAYDHLPDGLPAPVDDGAADHLIGLAVPPIELPATTGQVVNLADIATSRTVLFIYPRTGQPGVALPPGWDDIPGARGCTPETIGFRDRAADFEKLSVRVYGLSSQDTAYQGELVERLGAPFAVLSDERLQLAAVLGLPVFEVSGLRLYTRITLVLDRGVVEQVFYPVFPTDTHADRVLDWLRARTEPRAADAARRTDEIQGARP